MSVVRHNGLKGEEVESVDSAPVVDAIATPPLRLGKQYGVKIPGLRLLLTQQRLAQWAWSLYSQVPKIGTAVGFFFPAVGANIANFGAPLMPGIGILFSVTSFMHNSLMKLAREDLQTMADMLNMPGGQAVDIAVMKETAVAALEASRQSTANVQKMLSHIDRVLVELASLRHVYPDDEVDEEEVNDEARVAERAQPIADVTDAADQTEGPTVDSSLKHISEEMKFVRELQLSNAATLERNQLALSNLVPKLDHMITLLTTAQSLAAQGLDRMDRVNHATSRDTWTTKYKRMLRGALSQLKTTTPVLSDQAASEEFINRWIEAFDSVKAVRLEPRAARAPFSFRDIEEYIERDPQFETIVNKMIRWRSEYKSSHAYRLIKLKSVLIKMLFSFCTHWAFQAPRDMDPEIRARHSGLLYTEYVQVDKRRCIEPVEADWSAHYLWVAEDTGRPTIRSMSPETDWSELIPEDAEGTCYQIKMEGSCVILLDVRAESLFRHRQRHSKALNFGREGGMDLYNKLGRMVYAASDAISAKDLLSSLRAAIAEVGRTSQTESLLRKLDRAEARFNFDTTEDASVEPEDVASVRVAEEDDRPVEP
eukprot:GILK01002754.1.p1 GENE.GILK01002754.1~~GILK01002754.1.p1  ORF type:complete len:641 (-),score=76.06 GILK01002754.1:48-1832(-)